MSLPKKRSRNNSKNSIYVETSELRKAAAVIQITNCISLLERKLWNIFLENAYERLLTCDTHTIQVTDLRDRMNWEFENYRLLISALESLVTTPIRFGLIDRDNPSQNEFGVSGLLASGSYKDGVITYEFSKKIRPLLYNPEVFGLINMSIALKLDSKYSLCLYENGIRFLDQDQGHGKSDYIPVVEFRELLGVDPSTEWKYINRDCILPALGEIEEKTNVKVSLDFKRGGKGRAVQAVQIAVEHKKQTEMDLSEQQDFILHKQIIDKMKLINVTHSVAVELAGSFPEKYLEEKLDYTLKGHRKNAAAFFVSAVRNDYKVQPVVIEPTKPKVETPTASVPKSRDIWNPLELFSGLTDVEKQFVVSRFLSNSVSKPVPPEMKADFSSSLEATDPLIRGPFEIYLSSYLKSDLKKLASSNK